MVVITNLIDNTVHILLLGDANGHGQKSIATTTILYLQKIQGLEGKIGKIPTSESYQRNKRVIVNSRRERKRIVTFVDLDFSHSGLNSRLDVFSTMPRGSPSSPLLHLSCCCPPLNSLALKSI